MVLISAGQLAELQTTSHHSRSMEELPSSFCYKFVFYSKFWATDAVFFKVWKTFPFNPCTTHPHRNLKTVCPLLQSLCQVSRSVSKSPSQSFSFVQLAFRLSLIYIQQFGLTIFYLPSSWLMFYCCLIVVVFMVWSCHKIWHRWCLIILHVRLND